MARKLRDLLTHPAPGVSPALQRALGRTMRPIEAFLHTQVASGVALLLASVIALVWANSPWSDTYHALWSTNAGVSFGELAYQQPLRFWINEVLMTFFFFVVGLEIRREMTGGELSDRRRAALPVAAALGGMIVPAAIFIALNAGRASASGWGVPMATDIAFALGALTLLGSRVAPALRVLLLALAVIDDVGAILVIGLFYSSGIDPSGLALAAGGVVIILVLQRVGIRRPWLYLLPGAIVWEGIHAAGVHATLAGVIIGLLTPSRAWLPTKTVVELLRDIADKIRKQEGASAPSLDTLDEVRREATAPVEALTHSLHRWVAFGVMPLFALANAGVTVGTVDLGGGSLPLVAGITAGLVLGKPIGIVLASMLVVKLGLGGLPRGVTWRGVFVVGAVAGVGFTMSLFIAELAFGAADLEAAKLAILIGSVLAVAVALIGGRALLPKVPEHAGAARTESDAESSTEQ